MALTTAQTTASFASLFLAPAVTKLNSCYPLGSIMAAIAAGLLLNIGQLRQVACHVVYQTYHCLVLLAAVVESVWSSFKVITLTLSIMKLSA